MKGSFFIVYEPGITKCNLCDVISLRAARKSKELRALVLGSPGELCKAQEFSRVLVMAELKFFSKQQLLKSTLDYQDIISICDWFLVSRFSDCFYRCFDCL